MATELRIGVIDSGCSPEQAATLVAARRFRLEEGVLCEGEPVPDHLGHGSAVLARLQSEAGQLPALMAQVFDRQWSTSALQVAGALLWLVEEGATLVNLSLGLHQDRPVLRQACAEAQAAGVLLCASSPARVGRCIRPAILACCVSPAMPVVRQGSGPGWAAARPTSAGMSAGRAWPVRAWPVRP